MALVAVVGGVDCGAFRSAYTPDELRAYVHRRAPDVPLSDVVVPFEVTTEQIARAQRLLDFQGPSSARALALIDGMFSPNGFGLRYAPVVTTVAKETIERGYGNCMSLAAVFVGLARGVGLRAYFMDASDRIVELQKETEAIVKSGHITAVVATEKGLEALDFDRRLAGYRTMQVLDDVEALAHYHNNRGYELMYDAEQHGRPIDWEMVAREFFMAIKVSPRFVRAENNLGIASMRLGRPAEAEQHYLAAIRADPEFSTPYNNLGILYLQRGELEKAREVFATAVRLDPENPYVRENQALALEASDIDNPHVTSPPTLAPVTPSHFKKNLYPRSAPVEEAP